MNNIQAKITLMTKEQIQRVHKDTLKLLSTTGIRVDSERARAVFVKAIGKNSDSDIIHIPPELVEHALKTAPPAIELFDRFGSPAFCLGSDQNSETRFGIGVTNNSYQSPDTDEILPFSRKHLETATRLGNTLKNFDVISTPGVIQDIDSAHSEVIAALEMLANTSKPMVILVSDAKEFELTLRLYEHLHGDLTSKPFIVPYFNPVTPLVLNEDTSDKIFSTIERNLPFIFSSYGMSGATTPITASGTLVTLNAELLAGLVFAQLIKAGTPVILGSLPSVFEMKQMTSAYTSQTILVNLACSEMMSHYRIPHSGTSGSGPGWGPDLTASGTLWMNHLTSCLGQVDLAPFVGGNFDSLVFSPTTVIYSDEVIRQVRQFSQGFDLDTESIGLDAINTAGPGGNFLMSKQTMALFREVHEQHSHIWPGYSLEKWQSESSPAAEKVLRQHTLEIMANLQVPDDHDDLIKRGNTFLHKLD